MRWLALCSLAVLLLAACSDENSSGSDAGADADASSDTGDAGGDSPEVSADVTADLGDVEGPEIRDLRVTIEGELGSEVDLTRGDETRVLPEPAPASFRVFASDGESAAADLVVRVVNGGDTELGEQTAVFRNGLWNVSLTIEGGMALKVAVEDEAGNVTTSEYTLILPTQEEAVVGDWERRFFTEDQALTHRWEVTIGDGIWEQEQLDTGLEQTGDWWIDEDGLVTFTVTTSSDGDENPETIEWQAVSGLYVDDRYYAASGPFLAEGQGDDIADTWARDIALYQSDEEGTLQLVEERTETIVLRDDDTWTETWTGTDYRGETDEAIDQSWAGDYRIELNENYTENIGDFLVRSIDEIDGEAVEDEPDRWDLGIVRLGRLLVTPYLRDTE